MVVILASVIQNLQNVVRAVFVFGFSLCSHTNNFARVVMKNIARMENRHVKEAHALFLLSHLSCVNAISPPHTHSSVSHK